MTDNSVNQREIILDILMEVTQNNAYCHVALNQMLKKYQYLDKINRAFISRVTEGTIERMITIDYVINSYSTVQINKMKPVIRNILRLSVYQMMYMDNIPAAAVCNEAVKLAIKRGFINLKGFVNAVLRNISRGAEEFKLPNASTDLLKHMSLKYSIPEWIIEKWIEMLGMDETCICLERLLETKEGITVRCNNSKLSTDEIIKLITDENVIAKQHDYYKNSLIITGFDYIGKLKAFNMGYIQVQDISSTLSINAAGIKKGDYCIDVCAAPGGKTMHMLDILAGTGHVLARDISETKAFMIKDNIERAGFSNCEVEVADAMEYEESLDMKADVVIADLPCSGLGVIGKKQDIKYKMTAEKIIELANIQRNILKTVSRYVKKGGTLIYSTCTITNEENYDNLKWFTDNFDFSLASIDDYLPEELKGNTTAKGYIQMVPGVNNSDGFFFARLIRN